MTKQKSEITVDLDRITRQEYIDWRKGRKAITDDEDREPGDVEAYDFEVLYKKVVTGWPWGEITFDAYLGLTYAQSVEVDQAVIDAITAVNEKK